MPLEMFGTGRGSGLRRENKVVSRILLLHRAGWEIGLMYQTKVIGYEETNP